MKIEKRDPITGKTNTLDIPITEQQLSRVRLRNETGEYIQNIVPNLSADHREFLMTGIMPATWDILYPEEEENG